MDIADVRAGRDRSSLDAAWMVMGSLISGILIYGAAGWLVGGWLGAQQLVTAIGAIFGMGAATYLVIARLSSLGPPDSHAAMGLESSRRAGTARGAMDA